MREKRMSWRDRYFADYEAVTAVVSPRGDRKTVYRYTGLYQAWRGDGRELRREKLLLAGAEMAALGLFVVCALADAPINCSRLASGFGLLSLVPLLLEASGVIRFVLAKQYVPELTMEEVSTSIRYGCLLRALLTLLSVLAGMADVLLTGTASALDGLVAAGILASASLSFVIWRRYRGLLVDTYRNMNGTPGTKI